MSEHGRYGGGSIMVWADISRGGRADPQIVIKDLKTGLCYRDAIMNVYVRQYAGVIGTSSSLWTTTLDLIVPGWLRSTSCRRPSSEWTGQHYYTDLNPIEHVWKMLQVAILRRPVQPTTLVELENVLIEEWNNLEMTAIQRLIRSMRRRCQAVIASRGSHIIY